MIFHREAVSPIFPEHDKYSFAICSGCNCCFVKQNGRETRRSEPAQCCDYKNHQRCSKLTQFLAPLAEGQQAIVMALCPPSVCACFRKLILQKTS